MLTESTKFIIGMALVFVGVKGKKVVPEKKANKKMLPKPIPALDSEQWKAVQKEIKRKPTKADEKRYRRATETFKNCPL